MCALKHVKEGKASLNKQEYENAAKFANKAFKEIDEYLNSKQNPQLNLLLAPFHYFLGHVLTTYMENKTDPFGNLPQLEYESDEESENEEDYDEEEEEEEAQVK